MSLLALIVLIVAVGVLLWAVNTYVPMEPRIKTLLGLVVGVILVLVLLQAFGVIDSLRGVRVPRL